MIGDGLMSIFGAPVAREDHRRRAVLAARQMVELIRLFNEDQAARDKVQIQIGIASGRVVAGYTGTLLLVKGKTQPVTVYSVVVDSLVAEGV